MSQRLLPITLVALLYLCNLSILSAQCLPGQQEVTIKFRGDENTIVDNSHWEIRSATNQVIESGNTDAVHCLPTNACYSFHVLDDYGDGLGGEEPGYYAIIYDGQEIASNTYYGFEQTSFFGGCQPGSSCFSPITAEIDVSYTVDRGEEWYVFTPTISGYYEITNCGFDNSCNTTIWVYDRCLGLSGAESQQETIFFNDDHCEDDQAVVSGVLFAGATYYLRLGDENDDCAKQPFLWNLRFLGEVVGCMDPLAVNYHPLATIDSGDCEYSSGQSIVSGPDLIVAPGVLANSMYPTMVNGSGCYIEEGCIQGFGQRQVLRFTTHIKNIGTEDYVIGSPDPNSGQFEFDDCHGHWHQEGYAEYRVYDASNNLLPVGFKNGFCVLDLECSGGGNATYGCGYMGISAGCGDIYHSGLDCQWIDVTDMPDGIYTMVITVNWDQDPDIFGRDELSYDNNSDMVCFELTRNSSGNHSINLFSGCEFPVDCEGVVLGDAQLDCLGVCNGDGLHGDLNGNVIYDPGDVNMYIEGILDSNIPVYACTELTGNELIDIEDPAWLMECILTENSADGHDSHAHACQLPTTGLTNPDEWAEFSLLEHNLDEQYVVVGLENPDVEMIATHFKMNGIHISSVEMIATNFDAQLSYRSDGQVIAFSYTFDTATRLETAAPFVKIYYSSTTGADICLETVYTTINRDLERVQSLVSDDNCANDLAPCSPTSPLDSDDDGICDDVDICPGGDDNIDTDNDGVPDGCDICENADDNLDTDNDGTPDGCDICPDMPDEDDDNDGVCNLFDICPGSDDQIDVNMNGIPDGCESCLPEGSVSIDLYPAPVDGIYLSGQQVEICVTVNQWSITGTSEWLHAITFDFGTAWDYNSILPNPPASCDGNGTWGWYDTWIGCNSGDEFGPGFAYDSDAGVACNGTANDGDPGNNWGDGGNNCSSVPISSEFCFNILVGECPPGVYLSDARIAVQIWSDGYSGSWTQTGCNSGQIAAVSLTATCCSEGIGDADNDGIPDSCDDCPNAATGDSDGDSICDDLDICPDSDDLADADNDGTPDGCDDCPNSATGDSDGDSICDDLDICPGADDLADADNDGTPDGCDECPNSATGDSDGDSICDDLDICPGADDLADADNDGTPDGCDECPNSATGDSDGDSICDDLDICPGSDDLADADNDGTPDGCDDCPNSATGDSDGDSICDDLDTCPDSDDLADADNDGTPDGCDDCPNSATGDSDGDSICDDLDICPDSDDLADADNDGTPDGCDDCPNSATGDSDGDSICDDLDICPGADDLADADNDGTPDGCDDCPNSATGDSDGDSICDDLDTCPGSDDLADADNDGTPDGCDECPNSATGDSDGDSICDDLDICPDSDDLADADNDGTPDGCDDCPNSATGDSDGDSICDDLDICPDSDDLADADNDGTPDGCDDCPNSATGDSDGDSICDDLDICPGADDLADADNDGTPDGCDDCPNSATGDSDGDSICDDLDICPDSDDLADADNDGTPDGCDDCPNSATGDSDGDSICDDLDICPGADDLADADNDGTPDGCDDCPNSATGDSDGDSICDDLDTCPGSDDLADADNDGTPDGCDECPNSATGDSDGDSICDDLDICPGSDDLADADNDGTPDGCDDCPNSATGDSDGDSICDDLDICPGADDLADADNDGTPDGCDECPNSATGDSDGDSICDDLDICPGADDLADADNDGTPDGCDDCPNSATGDSDGDSICDDLDTCPGSDDLADADNDGTPDGCDDCPNSATGDSDGDTVCDDEDLCPGFDDYEDIDEDGIPDGCDDVINSLVELNAEQAIRSLFPNPTAGELQLHFSLPVSGSVSIYDLLGHNFGNYTLQQQSQQIFKLNQLPASTYLLVFIQEDGSRAVRRFVKIGI